ncbi:uncharacterized protein [Spinacia oleracea]|uniref:Neprosin PEP catalytic domain-containing protein n=1 Tax=Spinacia oleracea TaxID=3562 RepID=A0A9R0K355_SPIOL|nr:uncharacterized protein LOC110795147 [Spinacia oleracea]
MLVIYNNQEFNSQTKYGDLYDCVDFYKQPAFDHPLMKNHSSHPQMRPSFVPKWKEARNEVLVENMQLEDGGCPEGTIPIRRWSKDEFIQISQFTKDYVSRLKSNANQQQPGTHFAIVQTNSDPSKVKYYGVKCDFSIYNPHVTPQQYSSAEIIIQNGNDRIQFGWTAGQSHCYNMLCPGFVNVNKRVPIDIATKGTTIRGSTKIWFVSPFVYQDPKTGHWWLLLRNPVTPDIIVGYWPREIFTGLANGATYIAVGGEAYSPPAQPLPAMGNGYYPVEDATLSAFCSGFGVLDANHQQISPKQTVKYADNWHYGVYDREHYENLGRTIFFGGTTM